MRDAEQAESSNPIVFHEEATVAYLQNDYISRLFLKCLNYPFLASEQICRKAIRQVCKVTPRENFTTTLSRSCSDFWEPMFETMGLSLMRLCRYEDALEVFRKQLSLSRNKASAWANIGVCLGNLGRLTEAIEALNEAVLMRPNDEVVFF